jgi:glycine dehydrogenase
MLDTLGCDTMDQFMSQVVPESIALTSENRFKHNGKELSGINSETLMLERMNVLMKSNVVNKSFIGQGYYGTNTPSVIRRNVLENPKWYTPYTPYQAEIAQGRLE